MTSEPKSPEREFVPVEGQSFSSREDWVRRGRSRLTSHPDYHNTEHEGPAKGWRGAHFTALCFDQKGRRVRNGGDFQRAEDDGAFPVYWVWPDQIDALLRADEAQAMVAAELEAAARLGLDMAKANDLYHTAEKIEAVLASHGGHIRSLIAAAYEAAAQKCRADAGRLDTPDRIRALTPADASAALTERDNATWNSAIEAAQKAVTAACDERNAVDEAIARYAIAALKMEKQE